MFNRPNKLLEEAFTTILEDWLPQTPLLKIPLSYPTPRLSCVSLLSSLVPSSLHLPVPSSFPAAELLLIIIIPQNKKQKTKNKKQKTKNKKQKTKNKKQKTKHKTQNTKHKTQLTKKYPAFYFFFPFPPRQLLSF
jgi:hypothetical protein